MLPYWILLGYFVAGALFIPQQNNLGTRRPEVLFKLGAVLVIVFVGLRFEVGADWGNYLDRFDRARFGDLARVLGEGDPGYQFINWLFQQLGGSIWHVNLVCSSLFCWGIFRFSRLQSNAWLAMVVAIPYLVIVVGMGYTRQAVAIGILMAGLASHLRGGSMLRFAVYVTFAALFHKTAVAAFILLAFASERNKLVNFLLALAVGVLLYDILLSPDIDRLKESYLEARYASEGAAIRVTMCLIPAVAFLLKQRTLGFSEEERRLWRNSSLAALGLLVLLWVLPSSTVVDRLGLYILPLQLAVLPRLAGVFTQRNLGTLALILYSVAVEFVWLHYAHHAEAWLPYKVYPIF